MRHRRRRSRSRKRIRLMIGCPRRRWLKEAALILSGSIDGVACSSYSDGLMSVFSCRWTYFDSIRIIIGYPPPVRLHAALRPMITPSPVTWLTPLPAAIGRSHLNYLTSAIDCNVAWPAPSSSPKLRRNYHFLIEIDFSCWK